MEWVNYILILILIGWNASLGSRIRHEREMSQLESNHIKKMINVIEKKRMGFEPFIIDEEDE